MLKFRSASITTFWFAEKEPKSLPQDTLGPNWSKIQIVELKRPQNTDSATWRISANRGEDVMPSTAGFLVEIAAWRFGQIRWAFIPS